MTTIDNVYWKYIHHRFVPLLTICGFDASFTGFGCTVVIFGGATLEDVVDTL